MFAFPHTVKPDGLGNIWAVDGDARNGRGNQVFKFSPDGEMLQRVAAVIEPTLLMTPPNLLRPGLGDLWNLFNLSRRDRSHGCIRLNDAEKMANWVLDGQDPWDEDSIHEAMFGPTDGSEPQNNKQVGLKTPDVGAPREPRGYGHQYPYCSAV